MSGTDEELRKAVRVLLDAMDRTIFYDCGETNPRQDDPSEPDDMPLDGANCPVTVGMIRKVRSLL